MILRYCSLVSLLALVFQLPAQVCTGNLGENIFEEGDFGSGAENVVQDDPGIAPGFIYQRLPPPNDGFYTITNDMRRWPSVFGLWDAFADNSNDPDGYMMVVNAAFEPGLFYEQTIEGLCENTLYQFSADLRNVIQPGGNLIRPNVSFLLDGTDRFTTGPIAETGRWENYGFTFTTLPGQTELTLALRNNAPGGGGNDLALDNISFRACGPNARIAGVDELRICEDGNPATLTADIIGDQYDTPAQQWQQSFDEGQTWQDLPGETDPTYTHTDLRSGFYYYRYLLANGPVNLSNTKCRVVSNVKVVYVVPKRYEIVDTLCRGLTFSVGEQTYGSSGTTVDTLLSSLGCDSIVTLRLTVVEDPGLVPDFTLTPPSCDYLTDGSIELNGVANGPGPYVYVLDSVRRGLGVPLPGLGEGGYDYAIADRYGCAVSGTVELRSPNPFVIDLGEDLFLELGDAARLTYGTNAAIAEYRFEPPELADCTTGCEGLLLTPARSTLLSLTAVSPAGCEFTDSLRLTVISNRAVYAPTAFSPNGDGVNDRFVLYADPGRVVVIRDFEVYDRWGSLVYRRPELPPGDVPSGWDGTVAGQTAPTGVYHYRAVATFLDGVTSPLSGSFSLLR